MNLKVSEKFAEDFLSYFLGDGFGSRSKRDTEIWVLHSLLAEGQFADEFGEIDFHELSLVLKISETRVRNLAYEIDLRFGAKKDFPSELINLIERKRFEVQGDCVRFAVHNPLLKQAFEYEIRKLGGVSDGSFAKHVVTINTLIFEKLIDRLYGHSNQAQKIISSLPKELTESIFDKSSLVKEFVRAFVRTSGGRTADLLFDAINPVDLLKRLLI